MSITGRLTFERRLIRCNCCGEKGLAYVEGPFITIEAQWHGKRHSAVIDARKVVLESNQPGGRSAPLSAACRPVEKGDQCGAPPDRESR